jgi:hypothetical protein
MPEVVPFFNDLLRAVFRHSSVVAQRIDDMDPMADFHHAVHNLAASATGSKKRVSCPGFKSWHFGLFRVNSMLRCGA